MANVAEIVKHTAAEMQADMAKHGTGLHDWNPHIALHLFYIGPRQGRTTRGLFPEDDKRTAPDFGEMSKDEFNQAYGDLYEMFWGAP